MAEKIVGAVVYNKKFLLVQTPEDEWILPAIAQNEKESDFETLKRCMKEKLGYKEFKHVPNFCVKLSPTPKNPIIQVYYLVVAVEDEITLFEEYESAEWVSIQEAEEMIEYRNQLGVIAEAENYLFKGLKYKLISTSD